MEDVESKKRCVELEYELEKKRLETEYELEKKRLKQQAKLDKKRMETEKKREESRDKASKKRNEAETKKDKPTIKVSHPTTDTNSTSHMYVTEHKKWYKDPSWIRAVVAILGLIVGIVALVLTFM
jgi:uncharacterized protein YegJ (DUF2314 family)